jgi:hypothetical protein
MIKPLGPNGELACENCPGNGGTTHFEVHVSREPMERPHHLKTSNRRRWVARCTMCPATYAFHYGS